MSTGLLPRGCYSATGPACSFCAAASWQNQIFENCQYVLPVLHDSFQQRPQLRLAHGFLVPFHANLIAQWTT